MTYVERNKRYKDAHVAPPVGVLDAESVIQELIRGGVRAVCAGVRSIWVGEVASCGVYERLEVRGAGHARWWHELYQFDRGAVQIRMPDNYRVVRQIIP